MNDEVMRHPQHKLSIPSASAGAASGHATRTPTLFGVGGSAACGGSLGLTYPLRLKTPMSPASCEPASKLYALRQQVFHLQCYFFALSKRFESVKEVKVVHNLFSLRLRSKA